MTQMLVDGVKAITLCGNMVRIHCVMKQLKSENRTSNILKTARGNTLRFLMPRKTGP